MQSILKSLRLKDKSTHNGWVWRKAKGYWRKYFMGPNKAEEGRYGYNSMSEAELCLKKNCVESSNGPKMNLRSGNGNTLYTEEGTTQWKRSGCEPRKAHQACFPVAQVKYSLPQAISLALYPGRLVLSRWLIQLPQLASRCGERGALSTKGVWAFWSLKRSLPYCKNNMDFVLCIIFPITIANKYWVLAICQAQL